MHNREHIRETESLIAESEERPSVREIRKEK
jgi:hypothetical protein